MRKKDRNIPDKPLQTFSREYRVRYILKAPDKQEVLFTGNTRECAEYLGITNRRFANSVGKGRVWVVDRYIYIDRVQFREKVVLNDEERRLAKKNAEYAQQYRNRKKRFRFGFNERERIP